MTTLDFTRLVRFASTSRAEDIGLNSTSCPPTHRKRILSNASGGICTKPSASLFVFGTTADCQWFPVNHPIHVVVISWPQHSLFELVQNGLHGVRPQPTRHRCVARLGPTLFTRRPVPLLNGPTHGAVMNHRSHPDAYDCRRTTRLFGIEL